MPSTTTAVKVTRYISIAFFTAALACPCFDTASSDGFYGQGASLLLTGTLFFMFLWPGVVWLANPLLLFSWIYAGKKRDKSFTLSMIALILAFCFLFYKDLITDESGANTTPILAHAIGYWLWLASMATMVLGNFWLQMISKGNEGGVEL